MKLITLENLKNFWKDIKSYVDNGLSKKADSSHGTHVSYGTINGKEPGTPSAGTSSKVAREDHVHPVQTTVSGNAGTATKLATARTINGTNFDGSANITTANWGTARTITVGNTGKSVDGSGNVSWSLSEIGAASTAAATTSSNGLMTSSMVSTLNTASSRASDWDNFKNNGGRLSGLIELTKGANFVSASDDDTAGIGMSRPIGSKFQAARIVPGNWNGRCGIGLMAMADGENISSNINTGTAFVVDNEGSISMHHKKDGVWGGTGDIGLYGNIIPKALNLRNIGKSDNRWDTIYSKTIDVQNTISFKGGTSHMVTKPVTITDKVNYYKETFTNNNGNPSMFWRIEEDSLNSGVNQTGVYLLKSNTTNTGTFGPFTDSVIDLGSSGRKWKDIHLNGVSKKANGDTKLPNGLIMQWGTHTFPTGSNMEKRTSHVSFPIQFPQSVSFINSNINANTKSIVTNTHSATTSNFIIQIETTDGSTTNLGTIPITWIAIGY